MNCPKCGHSYFNHFLHGFRCTGSCDCKCVHSQDWIIIENQKIKIDILKEALEKIKNKVEKWGSEGRKKCFIGI